MPSSSCRALRADVTVTSTRGMHGPQMSELVFLHMLALLRDFPQMQRNQAERRWERWPQPLLSGKTIVIVGVGAIAEVPGAALQGIRHERLRRVRLASHAGRVRRHVRSRSDLRTAARSADFLVLIVPLSPQTENLIDASVTAQP